MSVFTGKFYGVGLGPGDPELVTLKALSALQRVGHIYAVASRQSDRSVSASIIAALPDVAAPLTELEFTMSTDWTERLKRIDVHAFTIAEQLKNGVDCAFVTIGDPMTYSTCSYLLRSLKKLLPKLNAEIIPGVNSWSALAARAQQPLAEDKQELRIVPGYATGEVELPDHATTVLLKTYHTRNQLLQIIPPDRDMIYGENLGLADEFYSNDPKDAAARPEAYLSMLIVNGGSNKQ
jgi:precorrin-2/cobalt-factor-2 C20-methyltransferase